MTRRSQRVVPAIDGLEGRQLLSVATGPTQAQLAGLTNPFNVRDFGYYTASGSRVTIEVKGPGNLYGTNVAPGGDLNLVYGGTNAHSIITVHVNRGSAPLASIKEASIPQGNYTGVGGQLLGSFLAPQLDLVPGGNINMTSGVGRVQLHSVGANTEIHLRDLPQTFAASLTSAPSRVTNVNIASTTGGTGSSSASGAATSSGSTAGISGTTGTSGSSTTGTASTSGTGAGTSAGSTAGTTATTGVSGVTSTGVAVTTVNQSTATGTPTALGQSTNIATFLVSQTFVVGGNGNTITIPPGETAVVPLASVSTTTPTSFTWAGRTQTYSTSSDGSTTLTGVTGLFTPTANLISTPNPANPGPNPAPPGVLFQVGAIVGANGNIGAGQIYGYDPALNALVEFNTVTGDVTRIVPVGGTPTGAAGVGLGQNGRELVVLLARGTTVQAFDATTGAPVGSFSTATLAPYGMKAVDGVAFNGVTTVLSDSAASVPVQSNGTTDFGVAVAINVKQSLAVGAAVSSGSPFVTDNGFSFAGDPTGVAGTTNVYQYGAAPFNAFEAPYRQAGFLSLGGFGLGSPFEQGRSALANPSNPQSTTPFINFGGASGPLTGQGPAVGGIENLLAVDRGVKNGGNAIQLYSPYSLGTQGTLSLKDPNRLVALSETFHPELAGSALVDIQGNVQAFNANSASGLVLNDQGNLNLVQIGTTTNSTIVGEPLGHVQMPRRHGQVLLFTTSRSVGTRGGVTIVPGLRSLGTLRLPS